MRILSIDIDQLEHCVPICAGMEWNLDELIEKIWDYAQMKRIYTKPKVFIFLVVVIPLGTNA